MLQVLTLAQKDQWDTIVNSFSKRDVYWLSGYVTAFRLHGDGEPLLFYYEDSSVRGINVVLKRDIAADPRFAELLPKNRYFDFSTPYGYGGWLIEGDDPAELFVAYEAWCKKAGIISEFVRFHPVICNHIYARQSYQVIPLGQTVAMKLDSPETIWENIAGNNRNKIRKAIKLGVEIKSGDTEELYRTFSAIYNQTMDHNNAEQYYYFQPEFYDCIRHDLRKNARLVYATKDDEIIAAAIILFENGFLNYHLSGTLTQYRNYAACNLLLYQVALWGCENGYKTFHLGGGVGSGEDALLVFKRSFYRGEDLCRFHIGKKIFLQETYDRLVAMRKDIERDFFPKYRA